ncbi:MAG: hypothetical protein JNN05_03155 [Candidatus Omnitrophica bacterium]|nr:hypothetical protein [Candidatus Omnitrophota bacterium]
MIQKRLLSIAFIVIAVPASFAGSAKNITLKDGSVIKGELVSFEKGTYILQTENLGRLQLPESNVVSISNGNISTQQLPQATPTSAIGTPGSSGFSGQVAAMQSQIMANPDTMKAVQAMAEDPEILSLVSDPNFVQQLTAAVNSNNMESVANDPKLQKLMQNSKIQALIQELQDNKSSR